MKPYFQIEDHSIYNCKWQDLDTDLIAGADLMIADPPYGISESKKRNETRGKIAQAQSYPIEDWDSQPPSKDDTEALLALDMEKVIWGANHIGLPPSSSWLVWNKDNGKSHFADCELAWTSHKTAVRKIDWRWQGMLQQPGHKKEVRYHRCQKPIGMLAQVLDRFSDDGDLIFDPYAGVCSVALACIFNGRQSISCEVSEQYCEIGAKRLEASLAGNDAFLFQGAK